MERIANYKKMYLEMISGTEQAMTHLSAHIKENGLDESVVSAMRILIRAEKNSEKIYLDSTEDNLVYLNKGIEISAK